MVGLEDDPFLLGFGNSSGATLKNGRVVIFVTFPGHFKQIQGFSTPPFCWLSDSISEVRSFTRLELSFFILNFAQPLGVERCEFASQVFCDFRFNKTEGFLRPQIWHVFFVKVGCCLKHLQISKCGWVFFSFFSIHFRFCHPESFKQVAFKNFHFSIPKFSEIMIFVPWQKLPKACNLHVQLCPENFPPWLCQVLDVFTRFWEIIQRFFWWESLITSNTWGSLTLPTPVPLPLGCPLRGLWKKLEKFPFLHLHLPIKIQHQGLTLPYSHVTWFVLMVTWLWVRGAQCARSA